MSYSQYTKSKGKASNFERKIVGFQKVGSAAFVQLPHTGQSVFVYSVS